MVETMFYDRPYTYIHAQDLAKSTIAIYMYIGVVTRCARSASTCAAMYIGGLCLVVSCFNPNPGMCLSQVLLTAIVSSFSSFPVFVN